MAWRWLTINLSLPVSAYIPSPSIPSLNDHSNLALHAERDTNLVAVNDSDYHYDYTKKKKSFGRSTTTENESLHTTSVGTMVTAGGNLTINALLDEEGNVGLKDSRNVFLQGSLLSAEGDVVVGAGENITVTANTEEHLDFQLKKKSGLGGITGKSRAETGADLLQVGSLIHSDKDVVMLAGNDLNIAGSTVNAGNNAELYAGLTNDDGDINIEARQHESFYESASKKKSFSVDFSSDSVSFGKTNTKTQDNTSVSNAASYVLAGGNITGDAARDITVTGSVLDAGETLQLESGRHITIQSGTSADSLGDEDKTKTAGVSWGGDDNSVSLFAGHETIGQRTQQDYEGVAGSHLSGNNVVLDAGSDINIIGSDVDAQRNINLTAGNDVNILASHESANISTRDTFTRDGLTLTANHNLGNAADAIGNIGGGDNAVSDASSVMKAMDAMNNIGPSGSAFLGQTTTTTTHQSLSDQARGSSLNAGEDVVVNAGNNATVSGSSVNAGRNISVDANDIVITSAENHTTVNDTHEYDQVGATLSANQSGASLTIGFAQSESDHEQVIVTTTGSSLNAGQDVSLNARNDLTVEGSDVNATRNIGLHAANDVNIIAGQGHTRSTLDEEHLSGGAGIAFGADGIGFTAYVAAGENDLDRENLIHSNSTVSAGEGLTITSGNNANISGANLHAQDVDMDIGGDLTVASVQDTGSVEGRRWDASASITVGAGVSASVNVGYGETEGSSAWVTDQTSIIGSNSVNITVGGHTQVDGALIANINEQGEDKGNLNLDTRTFGFTDLEDHNEETSSYLSVGIGVNGGSGHDTTQQKPNEGGKGSDGEGSGTSWSVSGSYYDRDQQQTTNATIGQGTITVRQDQETGTDSTAGLNRDASQSQVMTKDDETEIDLYVSSDSVKAARGLFQTDEDGNNVTLTHWKNNLTSLADPDAYARIGANLHELSQVDGETLAQAWEQAKTTLGLVKVEVPDPTLLDASVQAKIAAANEQGLPVEYLGLQDGEVQAVVIGNDIDVVGDQAVAQMTENIAVYEASGQRVDDVIAQGQQFLAELEAYDVFLTQTTTDRYIAGYNATSDTNYRINQAFLGNSSNTDEVTTWFVTLGEGAYQNDLASGVQEGVFVLGNTVLFGGPSLLAGATGAEVSTPQFDALTEWGYSSAEEWGISRDAIDTTRTVIDVAFIFRDVGDMASIATGIIRAPGKADDVVSGIGGIGSGNSTSTQGWSVTGNTGGDGTNRGFNNPLTGEGYGVNDPPVRIEGEWSQQDYFNALNGRTPAGLGRPDLHHADQMPGSGIHEVLPSQHRGNTVLHGQPNQGVTPEMRKNDKELHWWYRAREQGADGLFPDWIYDE